LRPGPEGRFLLLFLLLQFELVLEHPGDLGLDDPQFLAYLLDQAHRETQSRHEGLLGKSLQLDLVDEPFFLQLVDVGQNVALLLAYLVGDPKQELARGFGVVFILILVVVLHVHAVG